MARTFLLLIGLSLAACQSSPSTRPLTPDEAEACGFYAEVIRARFGADTRGVPVNVNAASGAALFRAWPAAPGLDEAITSELERQSLRDAPLQRVRCDWRALGLPAGRTTPAGSRMGLHLTQPSYAADRTWALVTVWERGAGTTCLFRGEAADWTRVACEETYQLIVAHDAFGGPRPG